MKAILSAVNWTFGIVILGTAIAPLASAGCAGLPDKPASTKSWLMQAAYHPGEYELDDHKGGSSDNPTIVGFWKFTFTSVGNSAFGITDGSPLDFGYVEWHSDGTEITNSGIHDPATSNFCMGAWANSGYLQYKLNHFALSWDNTGMFCTPPTGKTSCFAGEVNIRQQITLSHNGSSYSGTVTIDQYNPAGTSLIAHLTGTVTGQRVTAD